MAKDLLSPKTDVVFKLIFADENNADILADFIAAVTGLPADEFDEIKISDPHLRRFDAQDKLSILDLKL
ncbi:MAG: Rpn family recombination-promoting nuclease/putative transposase, partial [Spirochaetaceae bacterium]|nr:Rpn family recombination-promoting nuclease/putative transposase [Spirochaetaceae bacterium]